MGALVRFYVEHGNTVPYPPLFDGVHKNYGFVDTRNRPERVADIPEAQESAALADVLTMLAMPETHLISLGCDLGQHKAPTSRLETRRVAGGYVQVVPAHREAPDIELAFLKEVGKHLKKGLIEASGEDRWDVSLGLAPVILRFEEEIERQSIWIWFHCKASTFDRAFASRERLLQALAKIIQSTSRS